MEFLSTFWPFLVAALDIGAASGVTVHAVLRKRDERAVIAWVGLAWLAPFLGSSAYFLFGVNRIRRRRVSQRVESPSECRATAPPIDAELTDDQIDRLYPDTPGLASVGRVATGAPLLSGNSVQPLIDGDEAYPEMIAAIEAAEHSVGLLTYIFDRDRAGEAFVEALAAAVQRGVEVRVLIDHVGARQSQPTIVGRLKRAGVPTVTFNPTLLPLSVKHANLRNHRKILVVDGRTGFTGGTNIREGHWHELLPSNPIRCVHFRVEGPVVAHLREAFRIDWEFAAGERLAGEGWFPTLEAIGEVAARGIPDGPDEDFEEMLEVMLGALSIARHRVRIVSPYFLPPASLVSALRIAAMRGAEVDIVIPSRNNIPPVQWATMAQAWQLLERGCRIHLTPPPFDHTKLFVVDGVWSLIGSTNWDSRSLRLNFEYNLECYDVDLAGRLERIVEERVAVARLLTMDELRRRRLPRQLRDGLARLLSPYL